MQSRSCRVRLPVAPRTAALQAVPFAGFSRQEQWSGLPFPSPLPLYRKELMQQAWDWYPRLACKELGLQKVSIIFTTDKSVSPCGNHLYKQNCLYWPPAFLLRVWSLGMCQAENAYVASSPRNLGCCCCLVAKLCQTLSYSMDCSRPGFPVPH